MPITGRTDTGMERTVPVIGGVNIDIGGRSFAPLVGKDSNPGKVTVSLGGVGRNIAHNMSLLGIRVSLLTAIGDDAFSGKVTESCRENGIDLSCAVKIPGGATSVYLYLNDSNGDMALAIADMAICNSITPDYLARHLPLLEASPLVVADANIPAESIAWLAEHIEQPLFADCVSTKKAEKLRPFLGKLHTLKANRLEAELLTGISITDGQALQAAAKALLDTGLQRVFISLGAEGLFAADGNSMLRVAACPATVKNAGGAGDALMAALAYCWLNMLSLEDTCRFATAAASLATESEETINPAISAEVVRRRAEAAPRPVNLI